MIVGLIVSNQLQVSNTSETIDGVNIEPADAARQSILAQILKRLKEEGELCASIVQQIIEHHIEADELTEAGLAYEDVCAIERSLAWA